jgi:hypothetical protein
MTTSNRQESFTITEKLASLNLTSIERNEAMAAVRIAEVFVDFIQACSAGLRRVAEALAFKPSLKH